MALIAVLNVFKCSPLHLVDRMVAGLNRMQVDEDFREEIARKIF
jgi:hypothetical protein